MSNPVVALVVVILATLIPSQPGPEAARNLLSAAIAAAGGAENLARSPALGWHGKASIFIGERTIRIEGEWRTQPPGRAVVETVEIEKGPDSKRMLILNGDRGWIRVGGKDQPMPPAMLMNERDQFYLYYVLRLAPLSDPRFRLSAISSDPDGHRGMRVQREGHRDVDVYLDKANRVVRLVTTVHDPQADRDVNEELRLSGSVEADGVKWPARIQISQDGKPFFDLEVTNFRTAARLEELGAVSPR
jgi:hypothetical protein